MTRINGIGEMQRNDKFNWPITLALELICLSRGQEVMKWIYIRGLKEMV